LKDILLSLEFNSWKNVHINFFQFLHLIETPLHIEPNYYAITGLCVGRNTYLIRSYLKLELFCSEGECSNKIDIFKIEITLYCQGNCEVDTLHVSA